jgi:hypothetical protein
MNNSDNSKNTFLEKNFYSFIKGNSYFFEKFKPFFINHFMKFYKKSKIKSLTQENEFREKTKEFYDYLFISPFLIQNNITKEYFEFVYFLQSRNVKITDILNKVFLLMVNHYIKQVIKEKNGLKKLFILTQLTKFYIEYIEYHLTNEIEQISSIPKEIIRTYKTKGKLTLFSIYKGIPFAHTTSVLGVNFKNASISVSTNKYQIIAARFQKTIFILKEDSTYSFRAHIKEIDDKRKIFILDNIEKIKRSTPKRNFIRVQPKEDVSVILHYKDTSYKTKLYDISIRGICVIAPKIEITPGKLINICFKIKDFNYFKIDTIAELKSITKINEEQFRYHLYFELPPKEENILEKCITKREKEIIKELNEFLMKDYVDVD